MRGSSIGVLSARLNWSANDPSLFGSAYKEVWPSLSRLGESGTGQTFELGAQEDSRAALTPLAATGKEIRGLINGDWVAIESASS